MVTGTDRWTVENPDLHEPRLERELRVDAFAPPPAGDGAPGVPVVRFPQWQSCPGCNRLAHFKSFGALHDNQCQDCGEDLVPSRFVVACAKGHIADFPYHRWVHGPGVAASEEHRLSLNTNAATASLAGIEIWCSCGASRSMEDAFNKGKLRETAKCLGRRPWLTSNDDGCDEELRTLQRGASNVWFSDTRSALSIPPWSDGAHQALSRYWTMLRFADETALAGMIEGAKIADNSEYSVEELVLAAKQRRQRELTGDQPNADELRAEEYEALLKGKPDTGQGQEFVAVPGDVPDGLNGFLAQVMLVKRLREVRALVGFSRLVPSRDEEYVAPIAADRLPWLPAIAVTGEGVFLRLSEDALADWEGRAEVAARASLVNDQYAKAAAFWGAGTERKITPRFLLIHTFAHALIDQWSLDAGYPAASLRERLYVSDDMAGLLLYTANSDAAGSLGGVVAQAAPGRLETAVNEALHRFAWCSADPVCIESQAAGADSLNLAACHSCALLPETSCEERNTLLDRGLMIGTPEHREIGFFSDHIEQH